MNDLAQSLTRDCQLCHLVRNASIARVQKDQRALVRAEFNHRAHILDLACLDCHVQIPFLDKLQSGQGLTAAEERNRFPSRIQNLPGIEKCQTCHTGAKASNACATCHLFHPDTSNRSNLLLSAN